MSIRTFPVDLKSLPRRDYTLSAPAPRGLPTEEEFQAAMERLETENIAAAGKRQAPLGEPVVPKDASFDPEAFVMGYDPNDPVSLPFINEMARIGQVEGFHVVARCAPGSTVPVDPEVAGNVTALPSQGVQDVWTEDHGEYTLSGGAIVPPMLARGSELYTMQANARMERLYSAADAAEVKPNLTQYNLDEVLGPYPRANFPYHGAVHSTETNGGMVGAALAMGIPKYRMAVSYVEGGNFLPGTREDGTPFALVGKDSVAVTRGLMEQDGKRPTDAQALKTIGRDYGLKPSQIFAVEQPADFHLDMGMALATPGHALLNDSMAVLELQKGWVKDEGELGILEDQAKFRAEFESMAEKDLLAAGLEVHRLPAVFPPTSGNPEMNFVNLRQGVNEEGQKFAILLGGMPEREEAVAGELQKLGYEHVHFLSRDLTPQTLELWGGLKCRTKGYPEAPPIGGTGGGVPSSPKGSDRTCDTTKSSS